ncbi:hypothetical protein C7445_1295 [Alicyclobacillus sacchari]|uniref:DUF1989 domain-containing protein n=1 Tax=Alicyclobacillus sacchari TaxID=392010 RepID=A0A4R8L801_9BACL|nr:urea amidolyase associated protein UAAP2 [Alicyclobacillus sacchari]TDY38882.1 hypothetical protein C7445_1295 [Alicyclobacillus sacchari]GMA58673.1 urea carboxylase [Alicyclobacillus sacchari]
MSLMRVESRRNVSDADICHILSSGEGLMLTLEAGDVLRIVDLEGNQAVDTLFYDADCPFDHYSATQTIVRQRSIYLTTGTVLYTESGRALARIVADTCGRHDTLGGACSAQSNTVRYGHDKVHMHNCRDTFMLQIARFDPRLSKRDLAPNVNFFMNVPVTAEGGLEFSDGISAAQRYVEIESLRRTRVLISNCPQLNNPCNAYHPTPVEMVVWRA